MGRYSFDDGYGWPAYVTVAEKKAQAADQIAKLREKGVQVQPIQLTGSKIAQSFWGKGWCDHMESFSDYANRLPRGRSYVRHGAVCHLEIKDGQVEAQVCGSSLYKVRISIKPIAANKWTALKAACSGRIASLLDLLRGTLDKGVMEVVTDQRQGLFPLPGEMQFQCSCPDWAVMCKHVAAVLYGVGARLDHSPDLLFALRGVRHEELVDISAAVADATTKKTARKRIAPSGLGDVFGIDLAEADELAPSSLANTVEQAPPVGRGAASGRMVKKQPSKPGPEPPKRKISAPAAASRRQPAKKPAAKPAVKPAAPFPDPLTGLDILAWRTRLGESQAKFAARFDVSGSCVSQWENKGKRGVSMFSATLTCMKKVWKKTG